MPEGHSIRHLANTWTELTGSCFAISSPQGRFTDDALLIDGQRVTGVDAHGKHLFIRFEHLWLHIHLGRYGTFTWHGPDDPLIEPKPTTRMRAIWSEGYTDLVGPITCEVIDDAAKLRVHKRLGPDPLRDAESVSDIADLLVTTERPIGSLLMDQGVFAGVGNIFRAEVLWRHAVNPGRPCRDLDGVTLRSIWDDLVLMMNDAVWSVGSGTSTDHIPLPDGSLPAVHGYGNPYNRTFAYARGGLPCARCGESIVVHEVEGRKLYWCPACQVG